MSPLGVHAWQLLCGEVEVARVVDLRQPELFHRGHLEGSLNLPYERFQEEVLDAMADLAEGERVLVVDPGGARAAEMATWLRRRGVDASFLEGGLSSWTGPLEKTPRGER